MQNIYEVDGSHHLIFSKDFFQHCLSQALVDPQLEIINVHYNYPIGETETTRMKYAGEQKHLLGLFEYQLTYQSRGEQKDIFILVKSKTHYTILLEKLATVLIQANLKLNKSDLINYLAKTALLNTHLKEIKIYQLSLRNPILGKYIPTCFGTYIDDGSGTYIVLEAYLKDAYIIKDYRDISFWQKPQIIAAIRDLSHFHAAYYDNYSTVVSEAKLEFVMDAKRMESLKPLWLAYAEVLKEYEGDLFSKEDINFQFELIATLSTWWGKIDKMPKTLIYNDLQIRNLAMQPLGEQDWRLYLYDWECVAIQLPQRDFVELLCYVIDDSVSDEDLSEYFDYSHAELERATNRQINKRQWLEGCLYSLYDLRVDRMACQLVLSKVIFRADIARVFKSSKRLMSFINKQLG